MSLGENIYRLRTKRKMSQEDFASTMEVSRQSVSKWENDMAVPELEKLMKMAKLFEVSLDELVGNAPPQPAPEAVPEPEPVPAPAPGVTTGDLISVVLLIFASFIPVAVFFTADDHNSIFLLILGLFVVPPAATFIAARCSAKNELIFRAYLVYNIVIGIVMILAAPFGFWLCLVNMGFIWYWYNQM